jgi:hypothetical protein
MKRGEDRWDNSKRALEVRVADFEKAVKGIAAKVKSS